MTSALDVKNLTYVKKKAVSIYLFDLMVFNATFNNISVISWWSVLLVEENWRPGENNLSQLTDKLYHIMLYTSSWSKLAITISVVIGTDCIGSCKSNYHTITAVTPLKAFSIAKCRSHSFVLFYLWNVYNASQKSYILLLYSFQLTMMLFLQILTSSCYTNWSETF
jgi:hypothetical protein